MCVCVCVCVLRSNSIIKEYLNRGYRRYVRSNIICNWNSKFEHDVSVQGPFTSGVSQWIDNIEYNW